MNVPVRPAVPESRAAIWKENKGYWVLGVGCWVLGIGYWALGIGLLGGLLTMTRPEGIVLLALIVLDALGRCLCSIFVPPPKGPQSYLPGLLGLLLGFALLLLPYLLFNLTTTGLPLPNTFYAKQAEYQAEIVNVSFAVRLWRVIRPTVVGAQVLLLPGFAFAIYRTIRGKRMEAALPLVWWATTLALYAWRLPKDYQHGRYLIPTIPILVLFGSWGTLSLLRLDSRQTIVRALSRAVSIAVLVLLLMFWIIGARAYAADVGFIEREMVAVARWLEAHTPADALIAVHDIGAVGYGVDRPLLDLAGLITPEVVPFITDKARLLAFMEEKGADYVVFFPDWSPTYASMSQDPRLHPVYGTGYAWTLRQGHANMVVYETRWGSGTPRTE
jgi:hypothetical protein